MVNRNNVIVGQRIDRHPLEGKEPLAVYMKGVSVVAAQAQISGIIQTPEGEMTFQPGDYIVSDNPPTHAWPVRQRVFETTYELYEKVKGKKGPRGPQPPEEYVPALSTPPADVVRIRMESESRETPVVEVDTIEAQATANPPEVSQPPTKPGRIADSSSLPFAGQEPTK